MPVKWLLTPKGERLTFEEAPKWFEDKGLMPSWAVEAVIREHKDEKPAFHVRPSDVAPKFTCRRQRVWMSNHDYGINPLDAEAMLEGTGLHEVFGTTEIVVPTNNERLEVCGVPMRGRIDWLIDDRIEDLKSKTPFWIPRFPFKEQKAVDPTARPYAEIWLPKTDDDDLFGYKVQLSLYRVLLKKDGQAAPTKGRVWRRWGGVKADKARWKRYDFDLWDEAELEVQVGPWMRALRDGLALASTTDVEAWRNAPPDGRDMVGSRGNLWACDRCPLRDECSRESGWSSF